MISIITASYNYDKYISETIQSVLNQSYKDFELIIVDDGSKDNSLEIINNFATQDSRIKVFTHENNQNKGLSETLKLAISKCQGDYIAFLESDDVWSVNNLQNKVDAIEKNNNASILINDIDFIGEKDYIEKYISQKEEYFQTQKMLFLKGCFDIKEFLRNNYFPTFSCMAVKKEFLQKADFNTPSKPNIDWYLWVQILKKRPEIVHICSKDTKWRVHEGSYISNRNKKQINEFFNKIHDMIYIDVLPKPILYLSKLLHKQNIEKINRSFVLGFDKILAKKYPQIVKIFSV